MILFHLLEIIFPLIFLLVLGIFIFMFARGIHNNNHSPRLTVPAKIVSKRQSTMHHSHPNAGDISGAHGYHSTSSTTYFITFQVESGDRMELSMSGTEYGMLAEGDEGRLTFQGTRYLAFDRNI